jgi:sphingosine kinase
MSGHVGAAPILSDRFALTNTGRTALVELYSDCIRINYDDDNDNDNNKIINESGNLNELRLSDVIGTFVERPHKTNDNNAYLIINAYPSGETPAGSVVAKRLKLCVELAYSNASRPNNLKYNMIVAQRWHDTLKWLFSIQKSINDRCVPKKPYLVFVNPYSGSGKASKLFIKCVAPIWMQAALPYKIVLTEYSNHAREFVKRVDDLSAFAGIIVASGDGLVYEIINGLMDRADWSTAIRRTPVAQIPGGSANGMASSLCYLAGETFQNISLDEYATLMAFYISKSLPTEVDLIRIQLENGRLVHSFLNIEWAMVADVDYESEKYRCMGGFRFLIGIIKKLISNKIVEKYKKLKDRKTKFIYYCKQQ